MRRFLLVIALALITAACSSDAPSATTVFPAATATSSSTASTAPSVATTMPHGEGAQSLGDPYFPTLGNGGYDVSHYDIALAVDIDSAELEAVTTISAVAEETLATFNLDFVGLDIGAVTVDGADAAYVREGPELRISPDGGIVAGEEFAVSVAYSGRPDPYLVASAGVDFGWIQTPEGIYVIAEPDGARTWFPSNDHPTDKATFTFHVTVPKPFTAAANGELVETIDNGLTQTFVWDLESMMATYLATIVVGEYDRVESPGPDGVVIRDYIPTSFGGVLPDAFTITTEAIGVLEEWFGPYPFDRYGHAVVSDLGGALENQTLTLIGEHALFYEVVVHEIAHHWWGDAVSPASWQNIWLNEGFATFAEFLWEEHRGGEAAMYADMEGRHLSLQSAGYNAIGDPQVSELFARSVYWRGGLTLHALRVTVGDVAMKEIFRTYFDRYAGGHATTADFVAVAEEVSGMDLTALFDAWVYSTELPDIPRATDL